MIAIRSQKLTPRLARIARSATLAALASLALATIAHADTAPNGKIAFSSNADGDYDIYTMNADGSEVVNLTDGEAGPDDFTPAWSPDGSRIAFASTRGGDLDIWVMEADGSSPNRLTGASDQTNPTWSPDGTQLAYTGGDEAESDSDIYTINADGSDPTNITGPHQTLEYDDMLPDWSPDGTQILFQGVREGAWEVLTVNPDGSAERNLTGDDDPPYANINWAPSYRADGAKIVYSVEPNDGSNEWDVWVMNPDGSGKEDVLPDEEWQDLYGKWSPDGTQILFQSNRSGDHSELFVIDYPPAAPAEATGASVRAADPKQLTSAGNASNPDWARRERPTVVGITDAGFDPVVATLRQGGTLRWHNQTAQDRHVVDASDLGLFDSGALSPGQYHRFIPASAGTYRVEEAVGGSTALVRVPMIASPPRGLAPGQFKLIWSAQRPAGGFGFDVQIKRPGDVSWNLWKDDVNARRGYLTTSTAGAYRFRARLTRLSDGRALGWSPAVRIVAAS